MPEISRFFGIIIKMFMGDHPPPHFHVEYNEFKAVYEIESLELTHGWLPVKQKKLVEALAIIHQSELMENYSNLSSSNPSFFKIKPLE